MLKAYTGIAPKGDLLLIERLCCQLQGRSLLHINSTREGGGVAEILHRMIPLLEEFGIRARWEVIKGSAEFFDVTKKIHNSLQGSPEEFNEQMWQLHYEVNRANAETLDLTADGVFIHDPQPIPLIKFRPETKSVWFWRCHIDMSSPQRSTLEHILRYYQGYDAAIFSSQRFAPGKKALEFIIPPSIDPLSEKNIELTKDEIEQILRPYNIPLGRPIVLQVSRFDRFKDPIGVIKAYRLAKQYNDCVLVLAGSPATDDPEGEKVLQEVREFAANDPDIFILLLPPGSDRVINALQRAATVVLQKSLKEGFGLTVSEAMWKGKPVIGGAAGGIPLQVVHRVTGFLVHSVEGAAFRIRQLLNDKALAERMGQAAREHVRRNFLITRQIRDYLSIWYYMLAGQNQTLMI